MHLMLKRVVAAVVAAGGLALAPSALARHIAPTHRRHVHHTAARHQPVRIDALCRPRTLPRPPD